MKLQSIKGMNDIVPPDSERWQHAEELLFGVLKSYGYRQIRLPIMETTPVFARSIGDVTDIVQKEMYTFEDRNGDSLTLRPEGTASCVRALLENGLLHQGHRKLWYAGPMFRHERPQKGRYRQFHQIGVECFGLQGPDIDAELIMMTARMWSALGLKDLRLELNTLGTLESRGQYRSLLQEYFTAHHDELDSDSQDRLNRNPLRILDSKNPELRSLIAAAPKLEDHLDDDSKRHFDGLCETLTSAGIDFDINPHLVRGLDYYSNTVFEWITNKLGAQGTVCAGGRYDGLVELMGGKPTPAIGCAMGLERLIELAAESATVERVDTEADIYVIDVSGSHSMVGLSVAESLRDENAGWRVVYHCGGGSLKSQMKKANRSGARWAVIIGEQELAEQTATLKPLRNDGDQVTVARSQAAQTLNNAW